MIVSRLATKADAPRQPLIRERQAESVSAGIGELTQTLEQAQCLKHRRIDAHADGRVALLDPLQGRATGESAIGHYGGSQSATSPGVSKIVTKLAQAPVNCDGRAMRGRH